MKFFKYLLVGVGVLFLSAMIFIVADGLTDERNKSDVIVVFGNKVENKTTPSPRLKARLDAAAKAYGEELADKIIVSGAVGREGFEEAEVMKYYLMEFYEIPSEDIVMDKGGDTTYATAKYVSELADVYDWKRITVVSQYFHVHRAKLAFEKFGDSKIFGIHAQIFELRDLYSLPREVLATMKYKFLDYKKDNILEEVNYHPESWIPYADFGNLGFGFYLPEGYPVSVDSQIISEPSGYDDFFPLTSWRVSYADTFEDALLEFFEDNQPTDVYLMDDVQGEVIEVVRQGEGEIRGESYVWEHSSYVVGRPGFYVVFIGWEDFSLSGWDGYKKFLSSVYIK